jgi:glycosyltransferase involved in cell wall biosynthesis
MKILVVLLRSKGGVGRANSEIAKVLREKRYEVDILSREDDLGIYSLFKSVFPLRKKIKRLMKEKNYDIIYTQDYSCALPLLFPYPIFWREHFCCFCGTKKWRHPGIFFQGHHRIVQEIIGKIMGKKLVSIGDGIYKRFPKSTKIYRGVNIREFKSLRKKRDKIGWIDRDTEEISKKELEKISELTGLDLIIAKGIPRSKMNEFYNKCKVFVSLPRNDGYNNSWNEALAAGVPIIVGNEDGAGSFLPLKKINYDRSPKRKNYDRDKINKIVGIILRQKGKNQRKWLIKKGLTWEDKSDELIKFLAKGLKR